MRSQHPDSLPGSYTVMRFSEPVRRGRYYDPNDDMWRPSGSYGAPETILNCSRIDEALAAVGDLLDGGAASTPSSRQQSATYAAALQDHHARVVGYETISTVVGAYRITEPDSPTLDPAVAVWRNRDDAAGFDFVANASLSKVGEIVACDVAERLRDSPSAHAAAGDDASPVDVDDHIARLPTDWGYMLQQAGSRPCVRRIVGGNGETYQIAVNFIDHALCEQLIDVDVKNRFYFDALRLRDDAAPRWPEPTGVRRPDGTVVVRGTADQWQQLLLDANAFAADPDIEDEEMRQHAADLERSVEPLVDAAIPRGAWSYAPVDAALSL